MEKLTADYTSGVDDTFFRARNSSGLWWNASTEAFEAWDSGNVADYAIDATEDGESGFYDAAVPAGWPAGTYKYQFFDLAASVGSVDAGELTYSGTTEITLATVIAGLLAVQTQVQNNALATAEQLALLQIHGDANWQPGAVTVLPLTVTCAPWRFDQQRLEAVQYCRLGPYDLTLKDVAGQPVDVAGHTIAFVIYDRTGKYLWQVDDCLVMGDDNNIVRVLQDDQNTGAAGSFRYVLRDLTNDTALLLGELEIIVAADAVVAP